MEKDILVRNFERYKGALDNLVGEDVADKIVESLGGEETVMSASYSNLADSGSAGDGTFIRNVIKVANMAAKINELLPENFRAESDSIYKVCLLNQIGKVVMLSKNDNNWEVVNRGMLYKYNDLDGALRTCERSILICMNAGVKFTPVEYEAMGILDVSPDDDNYKKYFSSPLSSVVRQASELIGMINRLKKNDK
ncbi:MAG: hypothetical protein J6X18_01715 [Bacteroidales bacterium]|nr:hypothetical protein [Bacteroidales bacterium]